MNIGLIFAGGSGKRMNHTTMPKQFLNICGVPIIIRTISVFEEHPEIDAIVVVCIEEWIPHLKELLQTYNIRKVAAIVSGGSSGQESIFNGLKAAKDVAAENYVDAIVLIHDGVRPMIEQQTISDNIDSVKQYGSAITSVCVTETILEISDSNKIENIPRRSSTRIARAPQSFYLKDIYTSHERAIHEGKTDFIDSCSMMQYYGYSLYLINGPLENIKVTTREDFYSMRAMIEAKEDAQFF